MTWRLRMATATVGLFVLWAAPIWAEPVPIVSGTAVFDPLAGPGPRLLADLTGADFSVSLRWESANGTCLNPCAAGDVVRLFTTTFPVSPSQINAVTGPVENTAVGSVPPLTNLAFAGQLRFLGPDVVLPPVPADAESPFPVILTERFTFNGSLSGFVVLGVLDPRLVFSRDLFGWGTMRASFRGSGSTYVANRIEYEFEAVPEPATLLLVGSGLAACAVRRRRGASRAPRT